MITSQKSNCCGCQTCLFACPTKAIEMKTDEEGFIYPVINKDLCVGCNKCNSVCPFETKNQISYDPSVNAYIARSRKEEILSNSSSGGIFSHLSDYVMANKGVIYGAAFDDQHHVIHIRAINRSQRDRMRGSKYVQSDLSQVFLSIESDLANGQLVLFTGTPCQVAAIRNYVKLKRIDDKTLYTCDIICHGVTSPSIWDKYIDFVSHRYGKDQKIHDICFRDKSYGYGYNMTIAFEDHKYHKDDIIDPFIYIFSRNYAMRSSCHNCVMKSMERVSDITIGDFQKYKEFYPEFDDGKGISVIILNSPKGQQLLDCIQNPNTLIIRQTEIEKAMQINLHGQIPISKKRQQFFQDVKNKNFEQVLRMYTEYGLPLHIYGTLRRFARDTIYSVIGRKNR